MIARVTGTRTEAGDYMPVTRDMSAARLKLIIRWLQKEGA